MKVLDVNPGVVRWNDDGTRFAYTLRYYGVGTTWETRSDFDFPSANAAKQAMREKVAHERKRHGVNLSN
jgi:predicted Rdx family selenoprotein